MNDKIIKDCIAEVLNKQDSDITEITFATKQSIQIFKTNDWHFRFRIV